MDTRRSTFTNGALSRRKALAAAGSAAAGAALLAACGSGGNSRKQGSGSSLLAKPVDTSKEARRGGAYQSYRSIDVLSFDTAVSTQGSLSALGFAYSRLFYITPGYLEPTKYGISGDLVESWEWSPDDLTLTMKLRRGAGTAPVPPLNGRNMDAEDVMFSLRRFEAIGSYKTNYFNSASPNAPIVSYESPDASTVVFKLRYPTISLLPDLTSRVSTIFMIPREAESGFDSRTKPLGSGYFYLANYLPSSQLQWKRNPNFYDKRQPYLDEVDESILPEYATQLSQFRTGRIYTFPDIKAEDLLSTKRAVPDLGLYTANPPDGWNTVTFFGWKPGEKTPFRDERLRQAFSMSLDRDAFIDVLYNVAGFQAEGLPLDTRWCTAVSPVFPEWLDPRGKDFGPNAKYYQFDLAEAKKLMAAAGFPNGLRVQSSWTNSGYGELFVRKVQVVEGMARAAGFEFDDYNPNYPAEWNNNFRDIRGNFEGIAHRNWAGTQPDATTRAVFEFSSTPGNILYTGFDPDGKGDFSGDKTLEDMVIRAQREFDGEKRKTILHDLQRYAAKKQYNVRNPGGANTFVLAWPALKNFNVFQGGDSLVSFNEWIDDTAPPLKKT